jgi:hypothetical protein
VELGVVAIFSCCGVSLFWGRKRREKRRRKVRVWSACINTLYHKDAKYLHHSSNRLLFNLIKHNQPPTRLSFEARVEKNAVAVRF